MTKHMYQDTNLTGIIMLGQYQSGDIREALKKFRDPFERVHNYPNKWLYCDHVVQGEKVPIALTVSYEGSHTQPEHILVSALGLTKSVDEKSLKRYLDELLELTDIRELNSKREQFEAEPFKGWASVSRQM
jgi:hypothetical protein